MKITDLKFLTNDDIDYVGGLNNRRISHAAQAMASVWGRQAGGIQGLGGFTP